MSRFESSTFVRNPEVMNVDILRQACDSLGWTYRVQGQELIISDANQDAYLYGEYALKVDLATNEVSYNTYYMPSARNKVEELTQQFYRLNASYSKESLVKAFKQRGFTYRSDPKFKANKEQIYQFYMIGRSMDRQEDEPYAEIKFTVLSDGTIITDSDYLPNDVNERAHDAMDTLEILLGNKRVMTRKEVPAKYQAKMKPRRIGINTLVQG